MNSKEKNENRGHIIDMDLEKCQVFIKNIARPDEDPKGFTFDGTAKSNSHQLLPCYSAALLLCYSSTNNTAACMLCRYDLNTHTLTRRTYGGPTVTATAIPPFRHTYHSRV